MPRRGSAAQRPPTKIVIQGEPRTLRGFDRRLAGIERRLARIMPFDEWVRRQNPSDEKKEIRRDVVAAFEAERDRLLALRATMTAGKAEGS